KNDMDVSWDQSLVDLIPDFAEATTALQYHLAFARLNTRLNDTHAAYINSSVLFNYWKFNLSTHQPISLKKINNKAIIQRMFMEVPGLNNGDIVHQINGMDIDSLRKEYRK